MKETIAKINFLKTIIHQEGACNKAGSCDLCKRTLFASIPNSYEKRCYNLHRMAGIDYTSSAHTKNKDAILLAKKELLNLLKRIKNDNN